MSEQPSVSSASAALAAASQRFWDGYLEASPTWATVIGDRRFDDRLSDVTPAAMERQIAFFDGMVAEARGIDEEGLSASERVTRRMLIDEAATNATNLRTRTHEWSVDPIFGPTMWLLDLVDYQTIRTPEDGANLVTRWNGLADSERRELYAKYACHELHLFLYFRLSALQFLNPFFELALLNS